jgi:hypothetical protein
MIAFTFMKLSGKSTIFIAFGQRHIDNVLQADMMPEQLNIEQPELRPPNVTIPATFKGHVNYPDVLRALCFHIHHFPYLPSLPTAQFFSFPHFNLTH